MPAVTSVRISPADWDELRSSFHRSLLMETALASLAQNVDGCAWPIDGAEESPSAYVDLSHSEVIAALRERGFPPGQFDILVAILRGTLSFDSSFSDMVEVAGKAEAAQDLIPRNLQRLGIPSDFPVRFCNFTSGTLTFCVGENIVTLDDFLNFSREAARRVMVGGEFRDLLNAVTHIDENVLARFLPFRPRSKGLHVVEALAHLVRPLSIEERMVLARNPQAASPELLERVAQIMAYFSKELEEIRQQAEGGIPYSRIVFVLNELSLEAAVTSLLENKLAPPKPVVTEAPVQEVPKSSASRIPWGGFFRRVFNR